MINEFNDFKINNSNIYNPDFCQNIGGVNFCGSAVWNVSAVEIDVINNYWGHENGPTLDPQGELKGTFLMGPAIYEPFLTESWQPEEEGNPVIIVPGIIASYLNDASTDEEIWPNFWNMFWSLDDSYLDNLSLDIYGNQDPDNPILISSDIFREVDFVFLERDFFQGLITELENNGYEEGENLFVFPYDWRLDINWLAGDSPLEEIQTLKDKIEEIKTQTQADKVDIIAHSMGGLITKTYIKKYGQDSIGNFIDIATPHFGASKAFKVLMYGDNLNIPILNQERMEIISQNMPSMFQLLPSQEYFNIPDPDYKNYVADIYDLDNNGIKGNLDYDQTIEFMENTGRNDYLLPFNNDLHSEIDDLTASRTYNIIGCGQPTIGKIYILNKEKTGEYEYGLKYISGDGTVPLKSADAFGENKIYATGTTHAYLTSFNGIRQYILAVLEGEEDDFNFSEYSNLSQNSNFCSLSGTQVSYHSPIELHIYDSKGNHVGPDENGDIEMEIKGVQYDIIDGNKFVFLPVREEYTITGEAESQGSFNARIETIENNNYIQTVYYNEIPLESSSTNVQMEIIPDQTEYIMQIDQDGDNIFEAEASPDSILDEEESKDLEKPTTTINIIGQEGNNGWHISDIEVELIAEDNKTGILKTEYSLDNGIIWNIYENKFIISQNGTTTIIYSSIDRAGNREIEKEETIKIDQEKPSIEFVIPQQGQEILRSEIIDIEYDIEDNYSGIATNTIEIELDGNKLSTTTIDLFHYNLGQHVLRIEIFDIAGNSSSTKINFQITANTTSTISDINRAYSEGMITKEKVKDSLIKRLKSIQKYIERYGQREEKRKERQEEMINKCIAKRGEEWCREHLEKLFEKINYRLSKIHKKIVMFRYRILLKKLDLYKRKHWVNEQGHGIIKENIEYLINN